MKTKIFFLLCVGIFFISCSEKNSSKSQSVSQNEETAVSSPGKKEVVMSEAPAQVEIKEDNNQESEVIAEEKVAGSNKELYNHHTEEPKYWTIERQKEIYETLFKDKDLEEAKCFRNFILSLAKYHHDDPVYEYNPIFLCYEKYPEYLQSFLEINKDLFHIGNVYEGDYSESPFVYAVKNKSLEDVKFYFDNNLSPLEGNEDLIYGTMNAGGPRFGIGGNILYYAGTEEIRDYLISQGVPSEIDPASYLEFFLLEDDVNIYDNPGVNNQVLATISRNDSFKGIKVLAYKVDNARWLKIKFNEIEGWISSSSFAYDTGI
ncbi:MAG: SH3 domain-containing protein [Treponema sp.]|nr:SH3 domain-containing protein [Treponema sp.]